MTREEAERIVKKVSCRCDGRGVIPGGYATRTPDHPYGVAVPCPDCDGEFVSNDQFKEARKVLMEG